MVNSTFKDSLAYEICFCKYRFYSKKLNKTTKPIKKLSAH